MVVVNILNSSDVKVAQLDSNDCEVSTIRKINSTYNCTLSYPIPTEAIHDKSEYLTTYSSRIQIVDTQDSTVQKTFVISKYEKSKNNNGVLQIKVYGENKAISDLNNEIISDFIIISNQTVSEALTKILAFSSNWSAGSVTSSKKFSLSLGWESVLSAMQKILSSTDTEYNIDEVNSEIDIVDSLGANNYVFVKDGINLKSIKNTHYSRDVKNKIFGLGGGSNPVTIANARHKVNAYVSGTGVLTIDDNFVVAENDSWNTYKVYFETGSEAGNSYIITDSVSDSDNDTLTIDTALSISAGDKFRILDSGGGDVDYIIAGESITSYGSIEAVYKNDNYVDVVNLITTPQFDGTYTTGLCADWSKDGSPTLTENTDADFIIYGSSSQKIVGVSDADGVSQVITVENEKYYRLLVWVYIVSGAVKVKLSNASSDFESVKNSTGWQRFSFYINSDSTTATLKISQSGASVATFYIDACQLSEGVLDRSFVENCDQKSLWNETYNFLINNKDPLIEYQTSFIDLYKIDKNKYKYNEISLGDTVTISDTDLGISEVQARIREIKLIEFQPELTEYSVSNI